MKVIYGIKKIRRFRRPVVAMGVFDGVHLGHRSILKAAVAKAKSVKGTSMVLTFWPHPQKEESLYSLEHRLKLIEELGACACIVINFNRQFSGMAAEDFIQNILVNKIGASYVYVGKNFRFGRKAEGDCETLNMAAGHGGFQVKCFDVIKKNDQPISSTLIRRLIRRGDLREAEELLGRPVSILGTVNKGISLGRKLGFPTANIEAHHEVIPAHGVYAVKVIFKGKAYRGACYIGPKLEFLKKGSMTIEVYIFNFRKNIYGKYLEIQFLKKIREAKKFNSLAGLSKQINKDLRIIKAHFPLH